MRIRIIYFFEEALNSFRHNWVMSFAAITVVLISVLLVGAFVLLGHVTANVAQEMEDKLEIQVFLKDSAPQEEVYSIERKIKAFKDVEKVEYVSKKEALAIFKKRNKNNQSLIENIPGNPLPASYRVFMKNPREVQKVAEKIALFPEKESSIDDIKYGKEFASKLLGFTRIMRIGLFILIIFVSLSSLALISNTIRLAIFARRKEIAIMRLVGASNWFIRWPYLLEGIIQGLTGALLAIGILVLSKGFIQNKLGDSMGWLMSALRISPSFYQNMLLMLIAAGIIIGAAGSLIALRRHLKI